MLSDAAKNSMLDAWGVTHLSLHTAFSTSGANEVTGGSPAYARKAGSFASAASASKALSASVTFDVPASTTAQFVGMWSAITAGTFLGMLPLGGSERDFYADLTADTILAAAHGYVDDEQVVFIGGTPPGGLTQGTLYYVISATTDTFQVSATEGGSAINLTSQAAGACKVSKIVPETFGSQGTLDINTLTQGLTE